MNYILSLSISIISAVAIYGSDAIKPEELYGVYASGSEIAGFTGTVLKIEKGYRDGSLKFEELFYSDVKSDNMIEQDIIRGECAVIGDALVFARPYGFRHKDEIILGSTLSVYFPENINGKLLLFREDSHKSWKEKRKVYDYGILVKVKDKSDGFSLKNEVIPKVNLVDIFGIDNWQDPFVNGENKVK